MASRMAEIGDALAARMNGESEASFTIAKIGAQWRIDYIDHAGSVQVFGSTIQGAALALANALGME